MATSKTRTEGSRDGFASHAERAAADRLPLPLIGRIGFGLALITLCIVVFRFGSDLSNAGAWLFLLYGAGHVAGWWLARPRREAPGGYQAVAWLLLIQLAIYLTFWLNALSARDEGRYVDTWTLTDAAMIAFFLVGPLLGLASAWTARHGWVFFIAQGAGPVAFVLLW